MRLFSFTLALGLPSGTTLQIVSTSIALGGRVMSARCEVRFLFTFFFRSSSRFHLINEHLKNNTDPRQGLRAHHRLCVPHQDAACEALSFSFVSSLHFYTASAHEEQFRTKEKKRRKERRKKRRQSETSRTIWSPSSASASAHSTNLILSHPIWNRRTLHHCRTHEPTTNTRTLYSSTQAQALKFEGH